MNNIFLAAFGGAAAAGIITLIAVLTAEWFRWFLDRPLIKVSMTTGFTITGNSVSEKRLFLEARNPHSKQVVLNTFGLSFKHKKWGTLQINPQIGYQFPYRLDGQDSIRQWMMVEELLGTLYKAKRKPNDLKWVWFKASSGKLYRSKIKKWVIKELSGSFKKHTLH